MAFHGTWDTLHPPWKFAGEKKIVPLSPHGTVRRNRRQTVHVGHVRGDRISLAFPLRGFSLVRRDAARGRRTDRQDWCNLACARVESVLRSSGRLTRHRCLAPRHDGDFRPVALACLANAPCLTPVSYLPLPCLAST